MTWFILRLCLLLTAVSIGSPKSHRMEEKPKKRDEIMNVKVTIPRLMVGHSRHVKCAVRTIRGNAENRCCVFPFKYNNVTYFTCTYVNHKKPWCAVTKDYERDGLWGECPESVREVKDYHKRQHQNQSYTSNDQIPGFWNATQNATNESTEASGSSAVTSEHEDEAFSELIPFLDSALGLGAAPAASPSAAVPSSSSNSITPRLTSTPVTPGTTSIVTPNPTMNATAAGPIKTSVQPNNSSAIPSSSNVNVTQFSSHSVTVPAATTVGPGGGGQTTITTTCKTVVTQTVTQAGQTCAPTVPGLPNPVLPLPPYLIPGKAPTPATAVTSQPTATAAQPGLKVITEDIGCNGRKVETEEVWTGTEIVPPTQTVVEKPNEIIPNGNAGICKIILPSGKVVEVKPLPSISGPLSTTSQTILTGVTEATNQTQTSTILPSQSQSSVILSTANSNPMTPVPTTTTAGQVLPSKRLL